MPHVKRTVFPRIWIKLRHIRISKLRYSYPAAVIQADPLFQSNEPDAFGLVRLISHKQIILDKQQRDLCLALLLHPILDDGTKQIDLQLPGLSGYRSFIHYIETKSKAKVRGVRGAQAVDVIRVVGASIVALLESLDSWPDQGEIGIDPFIRYLFYSVDKAIRLELHRIRGEKYGLLEEADLLMKDYLGGSYGRYRAVSRAVSYLQQRDLSVNVRSVIYALDILGISPKLFGVKSVKNISPDAIIRHIAKVLNPSRLANVDVDSDDDLPPYTPISQDYMDYHKAISSIESNDIALSIRGKVGVSINHFEGYDFLIRMRDELMSALGSLPVDGAGVFSSREALAVDCLLFGDLPLTGKYSDHIPKRALNLLIAEKAFAKNDRKTAIEAKIRRLKEGSYIDIPDVSISKSSVWRSPIYSKDVVPIGLKDTHMNRAVWAMCETMGSFDLDSIKKNGSILKSILQNKIRRHGLLDPNSPNCLSCLKNL